MAFPDENIEQEDDSEVFEDPVKDPKDENIAEVPEDFTKTDEDDNKEDPFDTEDEDE